MYAELLVGLLFLLVGSAIRLRKVVVLPEETAGFVGTRLALVGAVLMAAALLVWASLLPAVALQAATFFVLLLAVATAIEMRIR